MILVFDVGNTNIVVGVYNERVLIYQEVSTINPARLTSSHSDKKSL